MMKILLAAINAKYIHTSYAAYSLKAFCGEPGANVKIREFTINQSPRFILDELFREDPDLIGFSCYIWNISMIRQLVPELRKVLPRTVFIAGGPEVSYESDELLGLPFFDLIVSGEGEAVFKRIVTEGLGQTAGLITGQPAPLDHIPFVYDGLNPEVYANRILYYESSRGCPFRCGYCLSGAEGHSVRFLSKSRLRDDLDFFLSRRVRQVKFLDRTFNCDKNHAMFIWKYLTEHDNGVTNFHFEITADLLDTEALDMLSRARKGLFQFEIGVQSTNNKTLDLIGRTTDTNRLFENVRKLRQMGNIHLHLDLIAGLPHEGYESFGRSFDAVYGLRPHQLQLGFLKLLKGSRLRSSAGEYGMVCLDGAPYEILYTDHITYPEISRLKDIEEMVETYYNSGRFSKTVLYLESFFSGPFSMYEALAGYWRHHNYHGIKHNKIGLYEILRDFCLQAAPQQEHVFCDLVKLDLLCHNEAYTLPRHMAGVFDEAEKEKTKAAVKKMYGSFSRQMIVEKFQFDVMNFTGLGNPPQQRNNYILFNAGWPGSAEELDITVTD